MYSKSVVQCKAQRHVLCIAGVASKSETTLIEMVDSVQHHNWYVLSVDTCRHEMSVQAASKAGTTAVQLVQEYTHVYLLCPQAA